MSKPQHKQKPDTVPLKHYLQGRKRSHVPHPVFEGEKVRLEDVTRAFFSYRWNGELHVRPFNTLTDEEIERITGE